MSMIDSLLKNADPIVASALEKALSAKDISVDEAVELFDSTGLELNLSVMVADELRKRTLGDYATYVVNRNINFTNVCIKQCGFCAFSRDFREEEGYFLPTEEIVRRAQEAASLGATEVCVQAGLPPKMDGHIYIDICKAVKKQLPDIHIHAFSPEEVLYGAIRSETPVPEYLKMLKEAGVGSLPGTAAEILDPSLRDIISPGRISVKDWIAVIKHAVARIMLNNHIPNIQVSWVKEGARMSQLLLAAGVNDFGGTLINESISTAAGAQHGQLMRPKEIRQLIRAAGRIPIQRSTTYRTLKVFVDENENLDSLLDSIDSSQFGSYHQLIKLDKFRYKDAKSNRSI